MDLFDFFFPEQAQASHLRRIANKRSTAPTKIVDHGNSEELRSLRKDVNFLTLVMTAILKRLGETETLSIGNVKDLLNEVDAMDGTADSGLDPNMLRGLLGAVNDSTNEPSTTDAAGIEIITTPRYRK